LKNRWLYLCVLDYVDNLNTPNVAHADVSYKTISNEFLHSFPSLLIGNCVVGLHSWICALGVVDPFWGISDFWVNILERDWEVDQVKIKIVQAKVFKSPFTGWLNMFRMMESVPEF
jgi:hypothetical protein